MIEENHPSTAPCASGDGSKPTGTVVTLAVSMPFAWRNAYQTEELADCTPTRLPMRLWGVLSGLLAGDVMPIGLSWYWAPMTEMPNPFCTAAAAVSSDVTATRAWPVSTICSWGVAPGPEGMTRTALNPSCTQ